MGSTTPFEGGKPVLEQDIHRLARLGVRLMNSIEGGAVVMNEYESSFVSEVKDEQDQDPIWIELKVSFFIRKK